HHASRRQTAVGIVIGVRCQADLFEVMRALRAGDDLTDLLNRRQHQPDQYRNDRDNDHELDQRERRTSGYGAHGNASLKIEVELVAGVAGYRSCALSSSRKALGSMGGCKLELIGTGE